ncbi:interleukin-1 beta [Scomber scombrus]|uniref:interleukin-1 beta n=1 Tax=Scomber scombrus TaxID=13677 RepID=UPI002DD7E118|nr:interleukin-1 beta [Scomber scombrus]
MKDVKDEIVRLDEGLNLVISRNRRTLKRVANLMLAVNRMKKPQMCCHDLTDEQLCSAIMGSLVDEKIVKMEHNSTTGITKYTFRRVKSEKQFTLCDIAHKDLCKEAESGEWKLQAVTLKGVNFKLARYCHPCEDRSNKGQTVVLSVMNSDMHITSSMNDNKAILTLEKCSEVKLQKISDDENMDRFLFYKKTTGVDLTTFESVKCPGWFISTSSNDECKAVEMCEVDTAYRLTSFKIN